MFQSRQAMQRPCINAPPTVLQAFIRALRIEVQQDILQAKRDYFEHNGDELGRVPCKETGALVTIDEADADHAAPFSFDVLACQRQTATAMPKAIRNL